MILEPQNFPNSLGIIPIEIEHFEDNKNKDINYDEDKGMFIIKNDGVLSIFGFGNSHVYEKDIGIQKINELKEKADQTTLTDYDINVLYDFAKLEFKFSGSKDEFLLTNIKNVFIGLKDDKLMMHKLIEMAYDYKNAIKRGETPVIERFVSTETSMQFNKNYLFVLLVIMVLLFIIYYFPY